MSYTPRTRIKKEIISEFILSVRRSNKVTILCSGMPGYPAKKLFDKFSRVKGIAQVNPDGSGLGLYITKKLSEAHGGGVWVESKGKGKGSSFCLWVPAGERS